VQQRSAEAKKAQQQLYERETDLGSRVQQIAHYDFENRTHQVKAWPQA